MQRGFHTPTSGESPPRVCGSWVQRTSTTSPRSFYDISARVKYRCAAHPSFPGDSLKGFFGGLPGNHRTRCKTREGRPFRVPAGGSSIVDRRLFDLSFGIIGDHQLQRSKDRHDARRTLVQVVANAVFELRDIDHVFFFRDTNPRAEVANRFRRVATPPQTGDGRHARIVPSRDVTLLHELQQFAFAHHRVVQVQARELDLPWPIALDQLFDTPIIERAMIFELKRTE
jgi:hypothetical protein